MLTLSFFGFGFSDGPSLRRLLRAADRDGGCYGDRFHGSGYGCSHGSSGGALEGVVGTELPPLGAEHRHHLGHGDFGVLFGNKGPDPKTRVGGGGQGAKREYTKTEGHLLHADQPIARLLFTWLDSEEPLLKN